jgi:uncharacterized membrane protein YgcG
VVAAALARTPLGAEEMALRKRLAAARAHLERELARERPRLDDTWIPYLLALGLGPDVDRWFGAYGRAGRTTWASDSATQGGSGASGGAPRWTGGAGAFSGGGATGTWAALGAIAASIAAPSSSSGSGSGGGSSSGGGGGGGW